LLIRITLGRTLFIGITLGSWMGVDEGSFADDDVLVGRNICAKSDIAFSTGSPTCIPGRDILF